ncbi:hypothetical protein L2E82_25006 [Cichorium intybus]|uniref:Uncharacterized protein n=1 Tax=Cichorium intybus TaxID=13427 RepID=A0ACB9E1W3_CICIN|nr:hypothetical protein L2E82_25006 [Cichorium intybus]
MTLKFLVDKKAQKVLFAEATKEFLDFLFHIFSLPLGSLIQLLGSKQMVGCLGELKESIENFDQTYLQPGIDKDVIFDPKMAFNGNMFLLSNDAFVDDKPAKSKTLYRCSSKVKDVSSDSEDSYDDDDDDDDYGSCRDHVTEHPNAVCPSCCYLMNVPLTYVRPPNMDTSVVKNALKNKRIPTCVSRQPKMDTAVVKEEAVKKKKLTGGYVKDVVTYMVMDNLVVKPMSTISSITLINSFGVKDLSILEEKTLPFGNDEALKLLKASLMTDQVLTTLFRQNV